MILYSLRCAGSHEFEGWFKDMGAYEAQVAARQIACPVCGSRRVEKAIMAPRVARAAAEAEPSRSVSAGKPEAEPQKVANLQGEEPPAAELRRQLQALRRKVEEACDYVGPQFAEEARKIHYGEAEGRSIYGETSEAEAESLAEEGVAFTRIPWVPRDDA